MAKAPHLATVKTRLSAGIGPIPAWAFYRKTLYTVAKKLKKDPRWQTFLAITPDTSLKSHRIWPHGPERFIQGSGDIGAKMARIMTALPPGPIIIVGSDIPQISTDHIQEAFFSLGNFDVIFGPASDGGFWLIGLRRRPILLQLFNGVRWSSKFALNDVIANLPKKAKIKYLEILTDIDTAENLRD